MATPLINGTTYSWANITVVGLGVPFIGITKINYKHSQKKENQYGAGSKPVSRGYGRDEYEASMEMPLADWQRIIKVAPNNDPTRIPAFDIKVSFTNAGAVSIDTLKAVEFTEDSVDASEGQTMLMVTIPLIIADIQHNIA